MTREQTNQLYKIEELLNQCRKELDNIMYNSTPITDEEHTKYRGVYDIICNALDNL